jgi:hypothetical protein
MTHTDCVFVSELSGLMLQFPSIFYGLCGSYKVLPMSRGGGINQKLLHDYAKYSGLPTRVLFHWIRL